MKITIYGKAPSVNSLYRIGKNGNLYLTRTGRTYKESVQALIEDAGIKLPPELRNVPLQISFKFYFINLWDRKAGKPIRRDYDGPIKVVQDAVAEALRFDDAWIFAAKWIEKRKGSKEKVVVTLERYEVQPDLDDE